MSAVFEEEPPFEPDDAPEDPALLAEPGNDDPLLHPAAMRATNIAASAKSHALFAPPFAPDLTIACCPPIPRGLTPVAARTVAKGSGSTLGGRVLGKRHLKGLT